VHPSSLLRQQDEAARAAVSDEASRKLPYFHAGSTDFAGF
jgi:hypothetical protein